MGRLQPATILMTATVHPAIGMPGSQRNDPIVRLNDYLEAFRFYLSMPDDVVGQIVILENSDADLSPFERLAADLGSRKAIRLINTSSKYSAKRGKGYGEFLMVDAGMTRLAEAGHLKPESVVWKITGRLTCANMQSLMSSAATNCSVYCDLRSVPFIGDRLGGNEWMDLRVFAFSARAYDLYFRGHYDADPVLEKGFFRIVREALAHDTGIVPRFKVQPQIRGFGGLDNRDYSSTKYRTKDLVRQVARRLAPVLWL